MCTSVARDPFARSSTVRTVERDGLALRRGCTWCGRLNGHGALYRYGTEYDGGKWSGWGNPFCSVGCARAYAD